MHEIQSVLQTEGLFVVICNDMSSEVTNKYVLQTIHMFSDVFCVINADNWSSRTFVLVLTTLSRIADSVTVGDKMLLVGK